MQVIRQYERISGNWEKYFKRLLVQKHRDGLTVEQVLEILEKQNYKCALSGVPLTCQLKIGTICKTNASFDRIRAGEEYNKDNVQLVCSIVNSWRSNSDLTEFIWFCEQITNNQKRKE